MKEFNAKDFAAQVPCAASTIKEWRRTKKLLPARYDGRICIYNESQLPLARDILKGIIPDIIIPRHVYNTLFLHAEKISNGQEDFINVLEKELCNLNIAADGDIYGFVEGTYWEPDFISRLKFFLAKRPLIVVDEDSNTRYRLVDYGETCDLELIDDATETAPATEQPARMDDHEGKKITPTGADENNISPNKFGTNVITPPANSQVQPNFSKDFLPMTIQPDFDAIPEIMQRLRRWLCWRLIPAEPKPKKVPMTPKNGKLVNASVTDSKNWLTFDEAISYFKRGLCTGIGFALSNTEPKICCVDVDHCFDEDGNLTTEAQSVIELCQNSFVEKSQSGGGIHVWFADDLFSGGRRKGNVEVYAADRYIAVTGVHIENTSTALLTVNGACNTVIEQFIDKSKTTTADNLFTSETTPTPEKNFALQTNTPITDTDRRLIDYLQSDKCRDHDPNIFALFNGDSASYFAAKGKPQDDSVADCDLLIKILYYVGNSGTDDQIAHRALNIFNQSELAKRPKWLDREDYRLRTLNAAFKIWIDGGRKSCATEPTLDSLNAQLKANSKDLADFNDHRTRAFESLRKLDTFDADTVFADDTITAAAFAFAYDKSLFATLKRDIKHYGDNHPPQKANINDFLAAVKFKADELQSQRADLINTENKIKAQIHSAQFTSQNDLLKNFSVPPEYSISSTRGVEKVTDKGFVTVCRRPVIVVEKAFNTDEKIIKFILAYQTKDGHWEKLPPVEAATIADNRRIITLANKGLPVTSTTATALVDYLDAFKAQNEDVLPITYTVPRCGWHTFNGDDYFIDPRRPCDISQGDKNFSVTVDERSTFAESLHTRGTLEHWKRAYELAKNSPVARFMTAAAVAPPLLKILGERNFLTYVFAHTRAGKTTGLNLGASTTGSEKIIRSFDATKNGLTGAAADVNDYAFLVDEKQVADPRIKEQFTALTYALSNGIGRTRLNKDSTLKKLQDWRTIAIMTGETQLLDDTATEGADTRLLSIRAPKVILPPDTCREIRDIIKRNYGHALPRVVDTITQLGEDFLRDRFRQTTAVFDQNKDLLDDHRRYLAVITLADVLLNLAIGNETNFDVAFGNAVESIGEVVKLVPTTAELSPTQKYRAFVRDFVTVNQNKFIHRDSNVAQMPAIFGKIEEYEWIYISAKVLADTCKQAGFDYRKLVTDLVDDGFFVPSDTIKKNCKTPTNTVQKKLGKANTECYRIRKNVFDGIEETTVTDDD